MIMSARLGRKVHEEFAQLVAKGVAQGKAYVQVYGGAKNDGATSN